MAYRSVIHAGGAPCLNIFTQNPSTATSTTITNEPIANKVDPTDSGKTKRSGPSKVKTELVYLGSATSIVQRLKKGEGPVQTHHREFGFVVAVYRTIVRIGLADFVTGAHSGPAFRLAAMAVFPLADHQPPWPRDQQTPNGRMGKQILFSDQLVAQSEWIIRQYKSKEMIEDDFKLIKSPDLIRFRPCRHWTDTKIRAFGFCRVMALVVIRVMLRQVELADLKMSANVLKEELSDLKQVIMIYTGQKAGTQITQRGTVQQRLWDLFELGAVEQDSTIR